MSRTALLVIDVQDSFLHRDYFRDDDMPAYQEAQTRLILGAMAKNVPVVRILHVDGDPEFTLESGLVRPMAWLPDHSDVTIEKHVHNAFTDTGLDRWLRERGITRLIVSGIRTEQCCETTTRVASDLGYEVDYVTEATLTFPMTHPVSGRTYSAQEIKEKTELVLHGRFARVTNVAGALAALG